MAGMVMLVIAGTALDYTCGGSPPGTPNPVVPKLHFTEPFCEK